MVATIQSRQSPMIFRCFRCEHPGYCQISESVLVRCARCNLVQPMDLATPYLANSSDSARPRRLPRRWRAIPGRRTVKKMILLGCVIGATGVAGLTMELLRARPQVVLRPPTVTASPRPGASADPVELASEDKRLRRSLRERRELGGRAERSRPAESASTLRALRPAELQPVLPPTGPDLPPSASTTRETAPSATTPPSTIRNAVAEPRWMSTPPGSMSPPPAPRLDQTTPASDGWWAEPDSNPWRQGS
jgi:hypothetical protein